MFLGCNVDSCLSTGNNGGSIGSITKSCYGDFSCEYAAYNGYLTSILPISDQLGTDNMHKNSDLFSKYRYALVTVPIYYGSRFVFEIFNPKAFIFFDLDIPHQALNEIQFSLP